LHYLGIEPDICKTEEEARKKVENISQSHSLTVSQSQKWPIYFFGSDTSGEKPYEEFFTDEEIKDEDSFVNLGVVKNSKKRDLKEIDAIFDQLRNLFDNNEITKSKIVEILKTYLPNFDHIETGKGLDSKM
jgi:FlaA1/EpsC-like NDP-sugar epimerase